MSCNYRDNFILKSILLSKKKIKLLYRHKIIITDLLGPFFKETLCSVFNCFKLILNLSPKK